MTWPTTRTDKASRMRVIIYADELLFSEALGSLLGMRGIEVMGFPTTTEDALRMVQTLPADAFIAKMSPGGSVTALGIALFKQIAPDLPIIVLTSDTDISQILQAIEAGASGICMKADGIDEVEQVLLRTVTLAAYKSTSSVIWSRGANSLARLPLATRTNDSEPTPREKEVLQAVARGKSTAEIAAQLGIGMATVRSHVQHLLQKFGAGSRLDLVARAIRADVIQVNDGAEIVVARSS